MTGLHPENPHIKKKYNIFRGLSQKVDGQQWTIQTGTVSDSDMTVGRKKLKINFWTTIQFSQL
jgi:hypothetical protein